MRETGLGRVVCALRHLPLECTSADRIVGPAANVGPITARSRGFGRSVCRDVADAKDAHSVSSSALFERIAAAWHRALVFVGASSPGVESITTETLRPILSASDREASCRTCVNTVGVGGVVAVGYLVEQDTALGIVDPASGIGPVGREVAWLGWDRDHWNRLGSGGTVGSSKAKHGKTITSSTVCGLVTRARHVAVGEWGNGVLSSNRIAAPAFLGVFCTRIDKVELPTSDLTVFVSDIRPAARDLTSLVAGQCSSTPLVKIASERVPTFGNHGWCWARDGCGRGGGTTESV
jgi:hypothetical protein